MLSPQLKKFIEASEKNEAIDLKDAPPGTLLRIRTKDHTYDILVAKPDEDMIVLQSDHPQLREPQVMYYQGATDGGSAVRLGRISVGLHMRMNLASGGLLVTSRVKMFTVLQDAQLAGVLQAVADDFEKKPEFSEAEFNQAIEQIITENFPPVVRQKVRNLLDEFNAEGKGVMLGFLDRAREAGKLDQAFEVIKRDLDEHWSYRPKKFRGSFITEADDWRARQMYAKLEMPLPMKKGG